MIPLVIFLLACVAIYLGCIGSAFSVLMRLSLRLQAERSDSPDSLVGYLDDPILLFAPVRLLLGLVTVAATTLIGIQIGFQGAPRFAIVMGSGAAFVGLFELVLPMLIVGRDPERVLDVLLPTFSPIARALAPLMKWISRVLQAGKRSAAPLATDEASEDAGAAATVPEPGAQDGIISGEDRQLLQSIVDFGDTLVREIMTPRPDIVAIRDSATLGDLIALFREQEYSRFPVYKESLDNIAGFVFVKDLVALEQRDTNGPISSLLRPAVIVPSSKRVPELLKQFQRQQTQIAIVVDEYGGTAGLVTIEDMLEEIVGEIRDEYDVESESVVDEGGGRYLFTGKVDIGEVTQRLNVPIEREGFETVGGYLLAHLGRVPAVGEEMELDGLHVQVLDVERRRINKVRIARREPDTAAVAQGQS